MAGLFQSLQNTASERSKYFFARFPQFSLSLTRERIILKFWSYRK